MAIPLTINEDAENGLSLDLSHRKFNGNAILHYTNNDKKIQIPMNSIISKYKDYFNPYIMEVPLTEDEENMYRYAPKRLSKDFYGSTEYWSIILFINDVHSILDFEPIGTVKLIQNNKIEPLINEIMILERVI